MAFLPKRDGKWEESDLLDAHFFSCFNPLPPQPLTMAADPSSQANPAAVKQTHLVRVEGGGARIGK